MSEEYEWVIHTFKKAIESTIVISKAPTGNIKDFGYLDSKIYNIIREVLKDYIVIDRRNHVVLDYAGSTVIIRKENESSNN